MWLLALTLLTAPPPAPTTAELIGALPTCESMDCAAAQTLLERKPLAELRAALSRPEELVRFWAAGLLGELKDLDAVPALVRSSGYGLSGAEETPPPEASLRVRSGALYALGQIGDKRATPTLVSALKHKDVNLRIGAVLGLGLLRDPASADALLSALSDKDDEVRGYSAAALGDLGERRAIAPITLRLREDLKPAVRALAATALGALGGDEALKALSAALEEDSHPDVRVECVRALAGHPSARAALEKASGQADPVGAAAKEALKAAKP